MTLPRDKRHITHTGTTFWLVRSLCLKKKRKPWAHGVHRAHTYAKLARRLYIYIYIHTHTGGHFLLGGLAIRLSRQKASSGIDRNMLSRVETTPCAIGIKLFGKVITAHAQQQPVLHRTGAAPPPQASTGRGSVGLLEEAARARAAAAEARLPCPRCQSRDTKFCYFNNYNVNQPRHFCRACHRYWTAGGAIRNVPVGSGRRKNRAMLLPSSAPHAATTTTSDEQGSDASGSPPAFSSPADFFAPYQWRWLVTSTSECSVPSHFD
jgi:hypothetical protein